MSEGEAYDHGFHDGLATAWQLMFSQVLGSQREFLEVLKELANLRNAARADAERHQDDDHCICVQDDINENCQWCF
jgi:hypothetical protein